MTREEITEVIKEIVREQLELGTGAEVRADVTLLEGGVGLDSITLVDFLGVVESRLKVQFSDEDLTPELIASIDSLAAAVEGRRGT